MTGRLPAAALCLALLAGCHSGKGTTTAPQQETDGSGLVERSPAATSASCRSPALVPEQVDGWPDSLKPGGDDLAALQDRFSTAYASVCGRDAIAAEGLDDPHGGAVRELTIRNAPDANVVSVYTAEGRLWLEAPLFRPGSSDVALPAPPEIEGALYCYLQGPTGEEDDGGCLPD